VNPVTGTITFTPESGYTGDPTPIQYTMQDNDGNTSNAATVTIDYVQIPPVAVDDESLANLPGPVTLNVTGNDSDPNGDLDVSTVDLNPGLAGIQNSLFVAGQGTWTVNSAGDVTFTPEAGFTGDPTPIPYTVSDATGLVSNQATITIDYVPVATDDSSSGHATGTAVTVNVLANDTTGDTPVASTVRIVGAGGTPVTSLTVTGQGEWTVNTTTGAITFTPQSGYTGDPTPIQYTVQDNDGTTSNAATVTIDYVQIPPVANNDSSPANSPGSVTLNVTTNDTDANGDLLVSTVDLDPGTLGIQTSLTVAGQGTWTVDSSGNVTFTPVSGFTLDPTPITYTVSDATGLVSNPATITIDYVPVASDDTTLGNTSGTPVTVDVLANDDTGDVVDPATVQIVGADPASDGRTKTVLGEGVWEVDRDTGEITFTPEAGFTTDPTPIEYTVQDEEGNTSDPAEVRVGYEQFPPVAEDDESLGNLPGPVVLNVTGNDSDPNGDLDVSTVDLDPTTSGIQGLLVVSGEGTWEVDNLGNVTFTPETGFTGDPDPIQYTVSDSTGRVSDPAWITVDYVPVATPDTSTGNTTGTPVTVDVLDNDTTGDTVVPTTVQIVGADPGSNGRTLTVPGQGVWTADPTTGEITFTPQSGYTGDPTPIQYTVADDDGNTSQPAQVTVDYNQFPPVAVGDSRLAQPAGPVTLNVTGNDSDPNGDLLVSTVDLNPGLAGIQNSLLVAGQGTWTVNAAGDVTFTPVAGFTGDPTPIPYTVSDATGLVSNQATITIDYVPVASNDSSSGHTTGTAVAVNVLTNDTTGDTPVPSTVQIVGTAGPGQPLTVTGQGEWTVNTTTGAITFTPQSGYTGDPTPIQYTVKDNDGNTSNAATVTVDYGQAPPVANNDASLGNPPGAGDVERDRQR
jgi:large repetitive protein